jgi:hypothetical protein
MYIANVNYVFSDRKWKKTIKAILSLGSENIVLINPEHRSGGLQTLPPAQSGFALSQPLP